MDNSQELLSNLTILAPYSSIGTGRKTKKRYICVCKCGTFKVVIANNIRTGNTRSCGCVGKENREKSITTHGMTNIEEYNIWGKMIQRCTNPKEPHYKDYGGRGIQVCEEWRKFENFYRDMGKRPRGLTLERINNDGSYCKDNCKWATTKEQANNKRNNCLIEHNGEKRTLSQWAEILQIKSATIAYRIRKGIDMSKKLSRKVSIA